MGGIGGGTDAGRGNGIDGRGKYGNRPSYHRGDDGTTSLYGGERVGKDSLRIELLGTLDELSASLGLVRAFGPSADTAALIRLLQEKLIVIAGRIADIRQITTSTFSAEEIVWLDQQLAAVEEPLPELTHFILPGEDRVSAFLHLARTAARRAERTAALFQEEPLEPNILAWLNRLSDLLFQLARKESLSSEFSSEEMKN